MHATHYTCLNPFLNKNRNSTLLVITLFSLLNLITPAKGFSQQDSSNKKQIAVFVPLYLDSAFDANANYRFGKTLPPYFTAGLEFYEGIQLAIDSLTKEQVDVTINIYDSRTGNTRPDILAQDSNFRKSSLIIGYVNVNESVQLARIAASMHVPFINVNLPNDAGVTNNNEYIILNPTLVTHATGIYKYVQKNHALSPIVYIRKKGTQEDRLKKYFTEVEKASSSVPLKMKEMMLEDSVNTEQLKSWLDTSKNNVVVVGSLDANFGLTICRQLASLGKPYRITVIGMPTWEQADLTKPFYKGIDVVYSSPTYLSADNKLVPVIQNYFKNRFFSRSGDMVFKAFETLYLAAHLNQMDKQLKSRNSTLFGEIDIQPVFNKQTGGIDYYENKKLYFIKKTDGVVKAIY